MLLEFGYLNGLWYVRYLTAGYHFTGPGDLSLLLDIFKIPLQVRGRIIRVVSAKLGKMLFQETPSKRIGDSHC